MKKSYLLFSVFICAAIPKTSLSGGRHDQRVMPEYGDQPPQAPTSSVTINGYRTIIQSPSVQSSSVLPPSVQSPSVLPPSKTPDKFTPNQYSNEECGTVFGCEDCEDYKEYIKSLQKKIELLECEINRIKSRSKRPKSGDCKSGSDNNNAPAKRLGLE